MSWPKIGGYIKVADEMRKIIELEKRFSKVVRVRVTRSKDGISRRIWYDYPAYLAYTKEENPEYFL